MVVTSIEKTWLKNFLTFLERYIEQKFMKTYLIDLYKNCIIVFSSFLSLSHSKSTEFDKLLRPYLLHLVNIVHSTMPVSCKMVDMTLYHNLDAPDTLLK